jgi:hypothetical protein
MQLLRTLRHFCYISPACPAIGSHLKLVIRMLRSLSVVKGKVADYLTSCLLIHLTLLVHLSSSFLNIRKFAKGVDQFACQTHRK